jgi:hypothetical protein
MCVVPASAVQALAVSIWRGFAAESTATRPLLITYPKDDLETSVWATAVLQRDVKGTELQEICMRCQHPPSRLVHDGRSL